MRSSAQSWSLSMNDGSATLVSEAEGGTGVEAAWPVPRVAPAAGGGALALPCGPSALQPPANVRSTRTATASALSPRETRHPTPYDQCSAGKASSGNSASPSSPALMRATYLLIESRAFLSLTKNAATQEISSKPPVIMKAMW